MDALDVMKVQGAIKVARKEFADEQWGYDDDTAVDAFIKILKKHVEELPNG